LILNSTASNLANEPETPLSISRHSAANIAATIDGGAGGAKKAPNMNVTQEQLNGIAKDSNDVLGLKAKATALPSEGDLNSLGAKLQKIKA
jgi:hypothetical protein